MWPSRKRGTERGPSDSEQAVEMARENLKASRQDRDDVHMVTRVIHKAIEENHISQRIALMLLKEE